MTERCECLDGGHNTGDGVCMCGGVIGTPSAAQGRERPEIPVGVRDFLDDWMEDVVQAWVGHWKGKGDNPPHRYSLDFGAFVGERLMTDFALRHREREARG